MSVEKRYYHITLVALRGFTGSLTTGNRHMDWLVRDSVVRALWRNFLPIITRKKCLNYYCWNKYNMYNVYNFFMIIDGDQRVRSVDRVDIQKCMKQVPKYIQTHTMSYNNVILWHDIHLNTTSDIEPHKFTKLLLVILVL